MAEQAVNESVFTRGKKRKSTPSEWEKNKIKEAKVKGKTHKTYDGTEKSGREKRIIECRCKCFAKMSEEDRQNIFTKFYLLKDHEAQNVYLQGCTIKKPEETIRRRPRKENAKDRSSFSYFVSTSKKSFQVCQAAFLALHGLQASRLKKKVLQFSKPIADGRGKHDNHKTLDPTIRRKVHEHIKKFPARESHYSRSKNKNTKYLDSSMTIAQMHREFIKENPELKDTCKYWLYQDVFNHEFNIKFGFPRSDICDKCEKYVAQIKAAETVADNVLIQKLKTDHELHIRKADVFNVQINEAIDAAKKSGDTAVISMDFEKNLPLPVTGIGQEYYKRQLWIHNLCFHDCLTDSATMYLYAEHFARKGPNDVISCLDHYISGLPAVISKIVIFVDNCFSQNKNRYLFAYLYHLVNTSTTLKEVFINYPLPGHSRMPCDRDFGRIEKRRKKKDRVVLPSEWVSLIKTTDITNPFRVVYVEHPLTDDQSNDGTPVVEVLDYKSTFDSLVRPVAGISEIRGAKFERGKVPLSRLSMTTECSDPIMLFKRGKKSSTLLQTRPRRAYATFLPIKLAKYNDIKALLDYVHLPAEATFYNYLSAVENASESEDEVDKE